MKIYESKNIARDGIVTVTPSSQRWEGNLTYSAQNVIDGKKVHGDVGVWVSNMERNPWIQLDWSGATRTIDHIVLYDLSDTSRNVNEGILRFSDGSILIVSGIPKNGAMKLISFPTKTVKWVRFEVTDGEGDANGLAEMEVYSSQ